MSDGLEMVCQQNKDNFYRRLNDCVCLKNEHTYDFGFKWNQIYSIKLNAVKTNKQCNDETEQSEVYRNAKQVWILLLPTPIGVSDHNFCHI